MARSRVAHKTEVTSLKDQLHAHEEHEHELEDLLDHMKKPFCLTEEDFNRMVAEGLENGTIGDSKRSRDRITELLAEIEDLRSASKSYAVQLTGASEKYEGLLRRKMSMEQMLTSRIRSETNDFERRMRELQELLQNKDEALALAQKAARDAEARLAEFKLWNRQKGKGKNSTLETLHMKDATVGGVMRNGDLLDSKRLQRKSKFAIPNEPLGRWVALPGTASLQHGLDHFVTDSPEAAQLVEAKDVLRFCTAKEAALGGLPPAFATLNASAPRKDLPMCIFFPERYDGISLRGAKVFRWRSAERSGSRRDLLKNVTGLTTARYNNPELGVLGPMLGVDAMEGIGNGEQKYGSRLLDESPLAAARGTATMSQKPTYWQRCVLVWGWESHFSSVRFFALLSAPIPSCCNPQGTRTHILPPSKDPADAIIDRGRGVERSQPSRAHGHSFALWVGRPARRHGRLVRLCRGRRA